MQFTGIHSHKKRFDHFLQNLIDIVLPRVCISCKTKGTALCAVCLKGTRAPTDNLPSWIHALYTYKSALIKQSIWKLKYSYTHDIARVYGKALYDRILEDCGDRILFEKEACVLVPIPVSSKRLRERGYNQAKLISDAILMNDTSGFLQNGDGIVFRRENTIRQSHTKNRAGRMQNIVGSFYTKRPLSSKVHYIIIDDVVTTGATLVEARQTLKQAGARKISAYTIAH